MLSMFISVSLHYYSLYKRRQIIYLCKRMYAYMSSEYQHDEQLKYL